MMRSVLLVLAVTLPVSSALADDPGTPPSPPGAAVSETGIASWYGYPYHGRHAASGEIYDMEKLTAAHRTLPFGTRLRVVNLTNDRSVEVRINDRGPFVDGRIIDLSRAAARAVDMENAGVSLVRLEVIDLPEETYPTLYAVQVGAFAKRWNAERCLARMRLRYGSAQIVLREGDPGLWRVLVGREATEEGARALAARRRSELVEGAFLTRLDPATPNPAEEHSAAPDR